MSKLIILHTVVVSHHTQLKNRDDWSRGGVQLVKAVKMLKQIITKAAYWALFCKNL